MRIMIAIFTLLLTQSIYADECTDRHKQCGHDDEANAVTSEVDVTVSSENSSESSSNSSGGSSTVSTRSENNSIVLTGARDTADCFTKVTIGAEGFGVGFSRSDKYCKKVRRISKHLELGNYEAAAKLECTLKEWREVYDDPDDCYRALYSGPRDPEPTSEVISIPVVEYEQLLMAQVAKEEFEEHAEQTEYRYNQQQSIIENLKKRVEDYEDNEEELDAIRKEQAEAERRRAKVREKLLDKKGGE